MVLVYESALRKVLHSNLTYDVIFYTRIVKVTVCASSGMQISFLCFFFNEYRDDNKIIIIITYFLIFILDTYLNTFAWRPN